MPYGFPKSLGGDSSANDALMERCVTKVMAQGNSKQAAIRICKVAISRRKQRQKGH